MATSDPALDAYLGVGEAPVPKKGGRALDDALDAYLTTERPEAPGFLGKLVKPIKEVLPRLAGMQGYQGEQGGPTLPQSLKSAAKTFWDTATSPEPTMGQELANAAPWLPIIPAVQDIISRTGRGFSGLIKGAAELGPEQAKPLTEALLGAAAGGDGALGALAETAGGAIPGVASAVRAAKPLSRLPKVAPLAPESPPPPIGVAGKALPPGPPSPLALPPRSQPLALPETTSGMIPQGPTVPPAPTPLGPVRKPGPKLPPSYPSQEKIDEITARYLGGAPKRSYAPDVGPPLDLPPPDVQGPVLDTASRPVTAEAPTMSERDRLRQLYKGRLDDPRIDLTGPPPGEEPPPLGAPEMPPGMPPPPPAGSPSPSGRPAVDPGVFGIEMDKGSAPMPPPAPTPTPNPELALRDYMAPSGTKVVQQIGPETVTWVKTGRNEWQGWYGGAHRKLTGESALNLAANPPAPSGPMTAPEIAANKVPPAPKLAAPSSSSYESPAPLPVNPPPLTERLPVNPRALPVQPPDVGQAPPRFEPTAIGDQGVIGGTPDKAAPPTGLKAAVPQADLKAGGLFGQERAASERASDAAQGGLEIGMRGRQQANVNEWLMDQLGGTYGIALTRAKNPEAIQPAVVAKLKSLGIDPVDAWHATHAEVPPPGVLDRLAELSVPKPALEAPKPLEMVKTYEAPPKARPAPFQASGDWETGVPNLADPDDVFAVIQGAGKIKVGNDLAGELRGVPAMFKSKNGQSLDRIAEGLVESYPHLGGGDRGAVKEQLLDTMTRYASLRRDKATAKVKQRPEFDVESSAPATQMRPGAIAPEDTVMKGWADFLSDMGRDESGAINLGKFGEAWNKAWTRQRRTLPMESKVLEDRPNSPVVSAIERATSWLSDKTQARTQMSWHKAVKAVDPEALKDAEVAAVAEWKANGSTSQAELAARHHFPSAVQAAMRQRDVLFDEANKVRAAFGEPATHRTPGPYLPREVVEGRQAISLRGEGFGGQMLKSERPGGHGQERAYETYRDGEAKGLEYLDPRNAILARDFDDLKIIATGKLFRELEARGALFRSEAQARAAGHAKPFGVEDAPFDREWWAPTESEARFLKQNLAENGGGQMSTLAHYANAVMRNPNLINPAPHIVKNMAFKMLLADGPVNMAKLARDSVEFFRESNPQLLKEFHEAMPFSTSGRTAGEALERGMVKQGVGGAAKKLIEIAGTVNAPSRTVIFKWADPAMRYSLFKHYREQGMDVFEAGNHAWLDLVRYGTRSDKVDFWKAMPLNFFVPWRFGTMVSLLKQATNHPIRAALTVGAAEYIREAVYRNTGYWWHYPTDYAQKPLAALAQAGSVKEGVLDAASTAATTALMGPGGDFSVKQLGQALEVIQGKENQFEWMRLRNAFWGIGQILDAPEEFARGDYAGLLGTVMLGAHRAYNYEPKRFSRDIPESIAGIPLPGMQRAPAVQQAEAAQARTKQLHERRQERMQARPRMSIEDRLRKSGAIR